MVKITKGWMATTPAPPPPHHPLTRYVSLNGLTIRGLKYLRSQKTKKLSVLKPEFLIKIVYGCQRIFLNPLPEMEKQVILTLRVIFGQR